MKIHRRVWRDPIILEGFKYVLSEILGPVDKVSSPDACSREIEESCKGRFGFVVSGGDPTELFELVEHSLDPVPVLVGPEVASNLLLAV